MDVYIAAVRNFPDWFVMEWWSMLRATKPDLELPDIPCTAQGIELVRVSMVLFMPKTDANAHDIGKGLNAKLAEAMDYRARWLGEYPFADDTTADLMMRFRADTRTLQQQGYDVKPHTIISVDDAGSMCTLLLIQVWQPGDAPGVRPALVFAYGTGQPYTATLLINHDRQDDGRRIAELLPEQGWIRLLQPAVQITTFVDDHLGHR